MNHEASNVVEALSELCAKVDVTTLIQVGADDGYESNEIREFMSCRAIAIDGDTRCVPISPTLEFHHLLIGATDSTTPFYVHSTLGLSSELTRADGKEKKALLQQYRLDTFCEMHGDIEPDALIIDTEGTTLDVLEGCGELLDRMKLIYAEVQTYELRPGVRLIGEVDKLLVAHGMTQHDGLPSYDGGAQGNATWIRT